MSPVSIWAQPPTPSQGLAPKLTITEASGKQTLLSSYRGKVVLLAFIFTTCPHCQAECGTLTKLLGELGSKGFQPLAVAFNDNAGMLVSSFVQNFRPSFPVGSENRKVVTDYLQLDDTGKVPWMVPQIVLIDRKGMIVEQSSPKGTEALQEEGSLRQKITELLGPGKMTSKKSER